MSGKRMNQEDLPELPPPYKWRLRKRFNEGTVLFLRVLLVGADESEACTADWDSDTNVLERYDKGKGIFVPVASDITLEEAIPIMTQLAYLGVLE